jgi:predicted nucleic acid-binding protein
VHVDDRWHDATMTRYVLDPFAAIELARRAVAVPEEHQLVAPARLRSDTLAILYRAARLGQEPADEARRLLDRITTMRIRLLNDRVSRGTAWRIADRQGWDDTADAEYVAVTQLQADALVALDSGLAARVADLVPVAPFDVLVAAP